MLNSDKNNTILYPFPCYVCNKEKETWISNVQVYRIHKVRCAAVAHGGRKL